MGVKESCSKDVFKYAFSCDHLLFPLSHMHHCAPPDWRHDLLPCHVISLCRMLKRRWVISKNDLCYIEVGICVIKYSGTFFGRSYALALRVSVVVERACVPVRAVSSFCLIEMDGM